MKRFRNRRFNEAYKIGLDKTVALCTIPFGRDGVNESTLEEVADVLMNVVDGANKSLARLTAECIAEHWDNESMVKTLIMGWYRENHTSFNEETNKMERTMKIHGKEINPGEIVTFRYPNDDMEIHLKVVNLVSPTQAMAVEVESDIPYWIEQEDKNHPNHSDGRFTDDVGIVFNVIPASDTEFQKYNEETSRMKRLHITKEQYNRSRYFKNKYGTLKYVSESGKLFKTSKGKVLKFNKGIYDHEDSVYYKYYAVYDGNWALNDKDTPFSGPFKTLKEAWAAAKKQCEKGIKLYKLEREYIFPSKRAYTMLYASDDDWASWFVLRLPADEEFKGENSYTYKDDALLRKEEPMDDGIEACDVDRREPHHYLEYFESRRRRRMNESDDWFGIPGASLVGNKIRYEGHLIDYYDFKDCLSGMCPSGSLSEWMHRNPDAVKDALEAFVDADEDWEETGLSESTRRFRESAVRGKSDYDKSMVKELENKIDQVYDYSDSSMYETMWNDELVDKLVTLQCRYAAITGHKYKSEKAYGHFHDEQEKKDSTRYNDNNDGVNTKYGWKSKDEVDSYPDLYK